MRVAGMVMTLAVLFALPAARARATGVAGPPCGPATARTLAAVDGRAAEQIYVDELAGPETSADKRQVETYAPLLQALAEGDRGAVEAAVSTLVYSHTHIVRLRVKHDGVLLADVGGPYIIAPVGGRLRLHGKVLGTYLLSVQDDLGVVGLESRLVGAQLSMSLDHRHVPLPGTLDPGSVALPARGPVGLHGVTYEAYSFTARAYPSGSLRITLLLAAVHDSSSSCTAVKVGEVARISERIWQRFALDKTPVAAFVSFDAGHTGTLVYVKAGSHLIAGSTRHSPTGLRDSGTLSFRGRTYAISSFPARRAGQSLRVYQLVAI